MTTARGRRTVAALLASGLALGLASCASAGGDPAATSTASPAPAVEQTTDDGVVGVEIAQGRSDYASGTISVRVEALASDVTVRSVVLSGDVLRTTAEWSDVTVVPRGASRDLRMTFPGASCASDDARTRVAIEYTVDETRSSADLDAADPGGVIERLAGRDCFAREVAATASLELAGDLVGPPSGDGSSVVELRVDPVDAAAGGFTIESVEATTLLEPAGGGPEWQLDVDVDGDDQAIGIPLEIAPARCDAHAVAEDKVGTLFPVRIALANGGDGVVLVAASDEVRAALYGFVARSCGW